MALTLRVKSYLGAPPALDQQHVIAEGGGTIGRGEGCTLTLPDPARKLSRIHAEVGFRDGQYVWSQLGANATLINDRPVTKGNQQVLVDGDQLAVGDYVLIAQLAALLPAYDASPLVPPPAAPAMPADPLADLDALGRIDLLGSAPPAAPGSAPTHLATPVVPAESQGSIDPGALDDLLGLPRSAPATGAPAYRGSESDHLAPIHQPFTPTPTPAPSGPAPAIPEDFDFLANTRFGSQRGAEAARPVAPSTPAPQVSARASTPPAVAAPAAPPPTPPARAPALDAPRPVTPAAQRSPDVTPTAPAAVPPVAPAPRPNPPPIASAPVTPPRPAAPPTAPAGGLPPSMPARTAAAAQPEVLAALLEGLGGGQWPQPEDGGVELARLAGQMLRESLNGTMAVLRARKAAQVEITRDYSLFGSNPLKVDPTIEAALLHMLSLRLPGYVPPLLAVRDAFKDIRSHEVGMVAGMQGLIEALLRELSPQRITERASQQGAMGQFFSSSRKAQLWDAYEREYQVLARVAGDDFFRLAGDAFAQAYAAAVDKLEATEPN